ncbi:hypothetical protein D3C81_1678010 [compost metagenome]
MNGAEVFQRGRRQSRAAAAIVDQNGAVGTADQSVAGVEDGTATQRDTLAAVGETTLVHTARTDALNGPVVFDVGDLVDVHAVAVTVRLQA